MALFEPFALYGYQIEIPSGISSSLFIQEAYQIDMSDTPFEIRSIISKFGDMVHMGDDSSVLVIGFHPDDSLERNIELLQELDTFILGSDDLIMFSISTTPKFYIGIECFSDSDIYEDSETESEAESENESEYESTDITTENESESDSETSIESSS
jgi:hypothetical protein